MNDPHVQTLRYRLRTYEGFSYKADADAVTFETSSFKATLEKGVLTVSMKEHYATTGEAMSCVQPDLRSWEIFTGVELGPGNLQFEFDGAEVIDRAPPVGGQFRLHAESASIGLFLSGKSKCHKVNGQYPSPPTQFIADNIVETLWRRYERYREGKEPLTGMGYFCLSVIEGDAGGRRQASTQFSIHFNVLSKMGELTSTAGDEAEARKRHPSNTFSPLTDQQRTWIDATVRRLIRRAGEYAANPTNNHPVVTMADLPPLT